MNILKKINLENCNRVYSTAFFYNCLYNIISEKTIDLFNCNLKKMCQINICDSYRSITISNKKNRFYAIKENDFANIYILNEKYIEIDRINLKISEIYKHPFKAISYDCDNNKILIASKNKIFSVTNNGDFIKEELSKNSQNSISYYIKTDVKKNINCCCNNQIVYAPVFTTIGYFCGKLYATYIKEKSLYMIEISNNGNIVNTYYIGDDIEVNSIINVNGNMQLLVTKNDKYNYIYITDLCCKTLCLDDYCNLCHKQHHKECCCDYCDIIESVALEQTALAHILNAEGEKIQKVLSNTDDICKILKTNESVNETLFNVTMLEHILFEKLKEANKCIKNNCICNKQL